MEPFSYSNSSKITVWFSLGEIGSGVHSDYGGVTVLHADGPGLYVLRPNQTSAEVK